MENLQEFAEKFINYAKESAVENECSLEHQITEDVIEYIKEDGAANFPEIILFENTKCNRNTDVDYFKISAFDYSESAGILDIFTTFCIETEGLADFTKKRIEIAMNSAMHFVSLCFKNSFDSDLLESNPNIVEIIDTISNEYKAGKIQLIRFFIITNGVCKSSYTFPETMEFEGKEFDCDFNLWDIENIRRSDIASRYDGAIDIDFSQYYSHSIKCLQLAEMDGVKSYLAIMPAIILAKVFKEYRARLLNQNVRNYLGGKIKVNKNMAKTLRDTPGMFFAYNNGISSTATEVVIQNESDGLYITNLRNWQIVNGGQTTNTIYNVFSADPERLEDAYVTMKVSEIKVDDESKKGEAISNIARYANSQTQIKESDLSGNIPYMLKMEELSRKEQTPINSLNGGTYWFFERMRGQYNVDRGEKSTRKAKDFLKLNPKNHLFTKADLAKIEMAWALAPFTSSKGAEQCYDQFYKSMLKDVDVLVDRKYYHNVVSKLIIYRSITEINKANGIKAYNNILSNYVLAAISLKSQGRLNLEYIWEHQEIQPVLKTFIVEASDIINKYILSISNRGDNPTVKAKNQTFWSEVQLRFVALQGLDKSVLYSGDDEKLSEKESKVISEFKAQYSMSVLRSVSMWGKETHKLSLLERKALDHAARFIETDKTLQNKEMLTVDAIVKKAKDNGYNK